MDIVFCLDKNILNSLKAIISSINYHTKRTVNYYVICPKDENRFFEDFINTNNLKNIKLGNFEPSDFILNLIKKCKYCSCSRISNYSRFFIKDTFPNLKKIIYLDTDMIILDDIGKLWDSVNLNENNFFASPKNILFHKLFYIKRLQYYYQYFNQSNYFNGGVFVTDLTFWDDKLYQKLFDITDNFLKNDICHTFTEAILNTLFPNFIQLDPSWNCSGYGNNKWYYILRLRDSNYKPKIIHWSGPTKPWHKKNIYKKKLWEYYLNENRHFVYLLYYDDNPTNGRADLFLDSVKNLSFNLVPHNVHQYEKFINFDINLGRNIKRHFCVKYFIENNGLDNYYIFTDAYDIYFVNFDYRIFDYIEENNIKVLYQNNTTGFSTNIFSDNVVNFYKKDVFSKSFGVNGGSFMGRGYNILNYYSDLFKYFKNNDTLDEGIIIRSPNLGDYVTLDSRSYFFNVEAMFKAIKPLYFNISDMKIHMKLNSDIYLFHYCGSRMKKKFTELQLYLKNKKLDDIEINYFRYYIFKFYYIIAPIIYPIIKLFVIFVNKIIGLFKFIFNNKEK